jgi:hypothetical protein
MMKSSLLLLLLSVITSPLSSSAQTEACKNIDWEDDEGFNCFDYDGTPEWCEEFGDCLHLDSSANEACCICGGGNRFVLAGPPTAAPTIEIIPGQKNCILSPSVEIADGLTIQNFVDYERDTFTMKLEYQGNSWIGIGFENDGRPGTPTFAVIGRILEDETQTVMKYVLNTKNPDASGVVEMPQGSQTLEGASFVQFDGKSTLTFTKPLNEDYDIPEQIVTNTTTWVYAVGLPDNAWAGRHTIAGKLNLALTPCFKQEWEITDPAVNGGLVDSNALDARAYFGEKPYKIIWLLHGICLGLAWGILCPLGIAFAFLKRKTKSWYKMHQACNNATLLLTCLGILLGVVATFMDDRATHLETDHSWFGLGVFCALLIETVLAFASSSLNYGNNQEKEQQEQALKQTYPTKERDVILGMGGGVEVLPPNSPHNPRNRNQTNNLYSDRQEEPPLVDKHEDDNVNEHPTGRGCGCCAWVHRILGYFAVSAGWYTCYTGIDLQNLHFDMDWSYYYWAAAAVGVLFMILASLLSYCLKDIKPSYNKNARKGKAPGNQNTEEAKPLGAQDAMVQRSFLSDAKADEIPEHDFGDDSNDDSSYEEATNHDLEDKDGQRSPLRKSWDVDTWCL